MVTAAPLPVDRPAPGHYRERLGSLLHRTRLTVIPTDAPPAPTPPQRARRARRSCGAQLVLRLDDRGADCLRGRR